MRQSQRSYEAFHVFQIALSVAMSVFLIALYVRPERTSVSSHMQDRHTQQTIYLMEVKYLSLDRKPTFQ